MENEASVGQPVEPVVARLVEGHALGSHLAEGEELELLERGDVHLGERRELFARVLPVAVGIEPLHGHGREHVVERPGVAHRRHPAVGPIDDLALGGDEDMRMRGRRRRGESHGKGRGRDHRASKSPGEMACGHGGSGSRRSVGCRGGSRPKRGDARHISFSSNTTFSRPALRRKMRSPASPATRQQIAMTKT